MERTNPLTRQAVRDWVGDHEIGKGRPYAEGSAISGALRVGDTLKANVQGTRDRPYRVSVKLADGRVASADCSCPVGDGGGCKHVAAVLLAYLDDPDRFAQVDDLDASLQKRDKAELIALVKQMVRRAPELETLLAAPLPGFGKARATPATFRRQALDVIRGMNPHDEWAGSEISEGLGEILEIGRAFEDGNDPESAAAVYQGVASAVTDEEIDYLGGYDGDPDVASELTAGLIRCLGRHPAGTPRRESLLRSLFDLLALYGDLGTDEDGNDQLEHLLDTITANERRTLSGWLRQGAGKKAKGDGYGSEYRARRLADLLLRVDADVMDDEAYLAHCRRYGLREDLVTRLIELGRKDEAVKEVAGITKDHDFLSFCDLLARHRLGAQAEELVRKRKACDKDAYLVRWLRERAVARKDSPEAAKLTETLLDLWPSLELYQDLKKWTPESEWPAKREAVLARLEKRKNHTLLTDIHLKEGNVDEAIRVMRLDRYPSRELAVAKAAEETRPEVSIEIYRKKAEQIIEHRDRAAYAEACKHLKKVGSLMARLGKADECRQYVAGLAEKYRALRAFQEELRKAKVLTEVPPDAVQLKGKRKPGG